MTQIQRKIIVDDKPISTGGGSEVIPTAVIDYSTLEFKDSKGDFIYDTSTVKTSDYHRLWLSVMNGIAVLDLQFEVNRSMSAFAEYTVATSNNAVLDNIMGQIYRSGIASIGSTAGSVAWKSNEQQPGIITVTASTSMSAGTVVKATFPINLESWEKTVVGEPPLSTPFNTHYEGEWIATASSATDTQLTQAITLDEGVWIVIGQNPPVASGSMLFGFENIPNFFWNSTGINSGSAVVVVPSGSTLTTYIKTANANARTYSEIEKGHIQAVKIDATGMMISGGEDGNGVSY